MNATNSTKGGKYIVVVVLIFMLFSWIWNIHAAVVRGQLNVAMGVWFVVSMWLMIRLWRGSPWARWITFAIYGFFGLWLMLYALANGSWYFGTCALILLILSTGLAMPAVGRFQRDQRRT